MTVLAPNEKIQVLVARTNLLSQGSTLDSSLVMFRTYFQQAGFELRSLGRPTNQQTLPEIELANYLTAK